LRRRYSPKLAGTGGNPGPWIDLGARVHGGFGAFIPIGIRIGLDAKERIKAEPRGLVVTYYTGEKAPCPCIADGVMLATGASPGQGTLLISSEKTPPRLARRHRRPQSKNRRGLALYHRR
jgi:hypothetical protein